MAHGAGQPGVPPQSVVAQLYYQTIPPYYLLQRFTDLPTSSTAPFAQMTAGATRLGRKHSSLSQWARSRKRRLST